MSLRSILIVLCVPASALAAYYGQPLVGHNSDAIVVLTTVMTVFAASSLLSLPFLVIRVLSRKVPGVAWNYVGLSLFRP